MSDLQIALAGIGIVVIGLVYAYNLWQERRLRKTLDGALAGPEADVLLDSVDARVEPVIKRKQSEDDATGLDAESGYGDDLPSVDPVLDHSVAVYCAADAADALHDALCESLAAFGTRVRVVDALKGEQREGIEAPVFLVAVQLVDRAGSLDEDVLDGIQSTISDVCRDHGGTVVIEESVSVAIGRARALEAVIAESDVLIGINILPVATAQFDTERIRSSAMSAGFSLAPDGKWILQDARGAAVATLIPFDASDGRVQSGWAAGVTILVDVPRVLNPCEAIDKVAALAASMAGHLDGTMVDDNRKPLTESGIAAIKNQLAVITERMAENGMAAGSARALRLFE